MAYEVTKSIKGRDYRYRVESRTNPDTGRPATRWTYLGKLEDGELIAPARPVMHRVTRDEIVAVTAKLLETRAASRVTVAVIAHHAGISSGTFYRHFADRDAAFAAALATLAEQCVDELPPLDAPVGTRDAERARFGNWFASLHRAIVRGRAFRWFMTAGGHDKFEAAIIESLRVDPRVLLADYFRTLEAAGVTRIGDADKLANGVLRLHTAVVRDVLLNDDGEVGALGRWAEVFPVIERAVFA